MGLLVTISVLILGKSVFALNIVKNGTVWFDDVELTQVK